MRTAVGHDGLTGRKVAVEHAGAVDRLAVVAAFDGAPGLALVPADAAGVDVRPQPSLDATLPLSTVALSGVDVAAAPAVTGELAERVLGRLAAVAGLLAAAESVGAAERLLDDARQYASERRQFGRTIGSNQALRHILADMYVRTASSWSTVLYAAAALDDEIEDAEQTAAIAKAYVARAAREVAHGALQVFGGIAFTQEHQAHRFLRRIIVREQQYGDARHHERALGRALAARASAAPTPPASAATLRAGELNRTVRSRHGHVIAQRLQRPDRPAAGADHDGCGPGGRRAAPGERSARPALARVRCRPRLGRQVEPDLPRGVRRRRGHPAPAAARAASSPRPTTWSASTGS